jgi:hypothetical protein
MDVAGWAESALADRIDEFAELIASHLAAALNYETELAGASGAAGLHGLRELACAAAVRAARRAASVSALPAAQRWQRMAIEQARILDAPARERMQLAADYYTYLWHEPEPLERVQIFSEGVEQFDRIPTATDDDRQTRARLQAALAEAHYETSGVEAAQATLRSGIADLEQGPPSRGRADLLRVLGWTMWRRGSSSDAAAILERAVADARSSDSDDALRWALHDLGIARTQTGRTDEGIELMEESFAMARRAGDRALMGRCYINVPLTKFDRGDPAIEVGPLFEEGLQLARRDGAVATISWLATNLAYEQEDLGRVDQELALAAESLDAAGRAGDDELVATARECLTWAHIVRGEHELALLEHERARSRARRQENRGYSANLDAVLGWADDPTRAYEELAAAFEPLTPENQAFASVARGLARMALRLADHQGLARATAAYLEATADRTGPIMVIRHRWFRGLAMDPSGSEVEAAAEELAAAGYRGNAAEAFADAALLAARAGRTSAAGERALAIAAEVGWHHILGPLPETRWVTGRPATRS